MCARNRRPAQRSSPRALAAARARRRRLWRATLLAIAGLTAAALVLTAVLPPAAPPPGGPLERQGPTPADGGEPADTGEPPPPWQALAFTPDGRVLLAAFQDLYARRWGGDDWAGGWEPFRPVPGRPVVALAARTDGHVLAATPAGGMNLFDPSTGRWEPRGEGLPAGRPVGVLAVAPSRPERAYAWVEGAGVFRSSDGGGTWEAVGASPGPVLSMAADGVAPERVYAGNERGFYVSGDAGSTWSPGGPLAGPVRGLATVSGRPGHVYAATDGGLLLSEDGGRSWRQVGDVSGPCVALAASPSAPARLAVACGPGGRWAVRVLPVEGEGAVPS
ncbi:MAG: hypothetical protein IRY95_08020 [Clostridia bacterium]|nr:hypothetical protein [Clostridia bacterium]